MTIGMIDRRVFNVEEKEQDFKLYMECLQESGDSEDRKYALNGLKELAEDGHAMACVNLGVAYVTGKAGEKDYAQARRYFEKSVKLDETLGYFYLGCLFFFGNGVKKDLTKARKLIRVAASRGHNAACEFLGRNKL